MLVVCNYNTNNKTRLLAGFVVQWSRRDLYFPYMDLIFNILQWLNFLLTETLIIFLSTD